MKILHLLYTSLPDTHGASIRSHQILKFQNKIGLEAIAITSPFQKSVVIDSSMEIIDNVKYFRTSAKQDFDFLTTKKAFLKRAEKITYIFRFLFKALKVSIREDVAVFHAHSHFFCGLTGLILSKILRKPLIYEVRSNWIRGIIDEGGLKSNSIVIKIYTFFENLVIKRAQEIVIIGEGLRNYVKNAGGNDASKCLVVRNCVDFDEVEERSKNFSSKSSTDNSKIRFGFIGSLYNYEGLDLLIDAFKSLNLKYPLTSLLIVGQGVELQKLKMLAVDNPAIYFFGAVKRDAIVQVYSDIDVIVLPRKNLEITNSVTPLKPLEAMGFKKALIASNVGGIKEIIIDNVTGVLFDADSKDGLINQMERFVHDPSLIGRFGEAGYVWAKSNLNWEVEVNKYMNLYTSLCSRE